MSLASVENPAVEASVIGLEPDKMSMPAKLSSGIKYSNAYKNTDIAYENRGYDIKESIIVNSPQTSYSYAFGINAKNLTAELNDGGAVEFKNAEGEIVFIVPAPYMVDANGAYSEAARYELSNKNGALTLSLTVDTEWMNAQERAYPVAIDPSVIVIAYSNSSNITITAVRQGAPNTSYPNYDSYGLGYGSLTSVRENMAYIGFDSLPSVPANCTIVNANLAIYQMDYSCAGPTSMTFCAYPVTSTKPSGSTYKSWISGRTWNTKPAYSNEVLDYVTAKSNKDDYYLIWDVTRAIKEWYTNSSKTRAIAIALENASQYSSNYASILTIYGNNGSYKPILNVAYRNTVGVEDYYTYQTVSAARAGTVHISDYSSQLTLINTDVSYSTEAISADISHVYNTAYANQHFDDANMNTQDFSAMKVGLGCKLSIQQTLKRATIGDTEYMIYNDADGTEHYFPKTATNTYEDEDGLGLKIVYKNNQYIMTDTDAYNTWTFSLYGYLISIADSNGNKTNINYANGHIANVTVQADGGTAVTIATLTYDSNNYLTKITDYRGNVTQYSYSNAGKLYQIAYADGTIVNYYYTVDGYITKTYDSESGYGLRFTYWNSKRLNCVTEYTANATDADGANDVLGNAFHVYKPSEQLASYRFYGPNHVSNMDEANGDDVLVNYVFDYSGRTICSYETDNTKSEVIGSSAASYTQNSGTSGKNNRLTGAGAMGMMYPNVYIDGGFENTWNVTGTGVSRKGRAETNVTDYSVHSGMYSMQLDGNGCYGVVPVSLEAEKEYTFSLYVSNHGTSGWKSGTSADSYIQPVLMNNSGTEMSISAFTQFKTQTSSSIDKGWEKLSWTFTAPLNAGQYKLGVKGGNFTGAVYVDDMQLEKNSVASQTNLLQNGKPINSSCWYFNGASYDGSTTQKSPFGSGVIKITGSPSANRSASQNVRVNDEKGGTYILSGWGKATAVGSTDREYTGDKPYFGLLAAVVYTDQSGEEWHLVPFNKDYSDWQYASGIVVPKRDAPVKLIRVYLIYKNNANTAYFDNISLVREPCSSYSYDDKGNPVSAKEGGAKTKCEYQSGTSILTKYTASTGVVTNFTYESGTHNLKTTTSAGITSANTYNAMGLVTSTKSTGSDYWYQETTSVYDGYGNKTSSTDVNGITTTNTYNNHFLTKTKTGDMPLQEYRYNVIDGRMNQTFMSGYAIQHYLYGNGQLSDLSRKGKFTGIEDFWQSYHFEYDSFGNMTRIGVSSADNKAAQNVGSGSYRTLASYEYEDGVNNGRLSKMTYGNGQTVNYEYDIFDRTTKETYNNGVKYNYAYDASGALAKQYSTNSSDTVLEEYRYEYDSLGRLIRSSEYNNSAFTQRTEHIYDESDRLTSQTWYNGSGATSQTYTYSGTTGLLTELEISYPGNTPNTKIDYSYEKLNRLDSKTTKVNGTTVFYTALWYYARSGYNRASQVQHFNYRDRNDNLILGFEYTYDGNGNIASEKSNVNDDTRSYTYDNQNQLTQAVYPDGTTYSYTYDTVGNIRSKKINNGTPIYYTYGDSKWADLLTAYNGEKIAYEGQTYNSENKTVTGTPISGNPTRYHNGSEYTFTWQQGRQLATAAKGSTNISYTYDMAGVRSSKTVGSTTYKYDTLSGKVMRQTWLGKAIEFIYDENNQPYAMRYRSTTNGVYNTYYYVLNVQGDVVGLLNSSGAIAAKYTYDPWGKVTVQNPSGTTNVSSSFIGNINPLRYRGYYYDTETGFYYLQTRYYDPAIGRFINADTYATTDAEGLLSTNMFAYCENNPVMGTDPTGEWVVQAAVIGAVIDVATYLVGCAQSGEKATWEGAGKAALKGAVTGVAFGAAGKAIKAVKAIVRATKVTEKGLKNGVAIGEKMIARVEPFAKANNLETYKGIPGYNKLESIVGNKIASKIGMWHNKKWVYNQMKRGVKIFDVGPAGSRISSRYYSMEREAVKGYYNYISVAKR